MVWAIQWTDQAVRDLAKLDHLVAKRVIAKLEQTASNPSRYFSRLAGGDEFKLRIGDCRLLVALVHETQTFLVERVDHRSRVYRRSP